MFLRASALRATDWNDVAESSLGALWWTSSQWAVTVLRSPLTEGHLVPPSPHTRAGASRRSSKQLRVRGVYRLGTGTGAVSSFNPVLSYST
jgi:hypothetical protein